MQAFRILFLDTHTVKNRKTYANVSQAVDVYLHIQHATYVRLLGNKNEGEIDTPSFSNK